MTGRAPGTADQGSASIELVVLAPAFGLVIALLVMGGRLAIADQTLDAAAAQAAREVSMVRGTDTRNAEDAARRYLEEQGLGCADMSVEIDASQKSTDPGTPSQQVSTTVSCDVPLSDLSLPGVSGHHRMTSTSSSPIDVYRER